MPSYTISPDLGQQDIPSDGILSRTVYNDGQVKAVVFGFDAGQELSRPDLFRLGEAFRLRRFCR